MIYSLRGGGLKERKNERKKKINKSEKEIKMILKYTLYFI